MIIRNIWCIGRNYQEHAKELGNEVPTSPLIFLKAGSCASVNSNEIHLPWWVEDVHHEVEFALKINTYYQVIEGAVALDLTERKLQTEAKKSGLPWTLAKSFDGACAISSFFSMKKFDDFRDRRLRLWVNDQLRQEGRTSQMIFSFEQILDFVQERFPVCPGDIILTGTPSGVGPLKAGDHVKVEIENEITHSWKIFQKKKPE